MRLLTGDERAKDLFHFWSDADVYATAASTSSPGGYVSDRNELARRIREQVRPGLLFFLEVEWHPQNLHRIQAERPVDRLCGRLPGLFGHGTVARHEWRQQLWRAGPVSDAHVQPRNVASWADLCRHDDARLPATRARHVVLASLGAESLRLHVQHEWLIGKE